MRIRSKAAETNPNTPIVYSSILHVKDINELNRIILVRKSVVKLEFLGAVGLQNNDEDDIVAPPDGIHKKK